MLPKYCIGDVSRAPGEAPPTTYEPDLGEGQFYHTLKKRVDAYFKDNKARRRSCPWQPRGCLSLSVADARPRLRSWTHALTPRCSSSRHASSSAWWLSGSGPSLAFPIASRCVTPHLTAALCALMHCSHPSLQASLLCAALLGAMKAEIGVSIMHDANHGAYSRSTLLGRIMGATLDVAGASRHAPDSSDALAWTH